MGNSYRHFYTFFFLLFSSFSFAQSVKKSDIIIINPTGKLTWNLISDKAVLTASGKSSQFWEGSLLPAFWMQMPGGEKIYVKAAVDASTSVIHPDSGLLQLKFGDWGQGTLQYHACQSGFMIDVFTIKWNRVVPAIIDLYFGTNKLTAEQKAVVSTADAVFWPAWQSEGYCVPAAKSAPVMSFFRSHILGDIDMSLGSFGTSSTPYAAAYPRPIYAAAMGGQNGWLAFGSGTVPESAMYLEVKATCGALRYRYREDLWGAGQQIRSWQRPLVMYWDTTAWDAFNWLFKAIDTSKPADAIHQKSHWNTWGDFSKGNYNMGAITKAAKNMGAEEVTMDMGWETSESTAIPNLKHLPNFDEDVKNVKQNGLQLGFWQSLIWVKDTLASGLGKADLLAGPDGRLSKSNIFHNPYWEAWSYYCIDPSSAKAREFLRSRTQNILKQTDASLLKLDFAYALLPPDAAAPRDPAYRGEQYAYRLIKIIADAAREINPDITIQYYGISPLLKQAYNLLALDDMADAAGDEPAGHAQWSIWAALAGQRGQAIMASSGYNWNNDAEILLNTSVIGSPGSVLNHTTPDGKPVPDRYLSKRKALNLWYRHTTGWQPLWLNSFKGDLDREPFLACWSRLENINGNNKLTALALRDPYQLLKGDADLTKIKWKGRWAIIAQDHNNIFDSKNLALIPFDKGRLILPFHNKPKDIQGIYLKSTKVYTDWNWHDGLLSVNVPSPELLNTLVGFLVTTR